VKGLLITFEGIDFCGKSVQSRLLFDKLKNHFKNSTIDKVVLLREPGGTIISEKIRDILLDRSLTMMNPITEMLLYEAARSQLISEIILPALLQEKIIICDRFYDSTTAYQGFGRSLSLDMIYKAHKIATHGVVPDVTFVIDLDPTIAKVRQKNAGRSRDRMELEDQNFHKNVRNGFLQIAKKEPERVSVLNGNQKIEEISDQIWNIIKKFLY
jgi:dTMP kinase